MKKNTASQVIGSQMISATDGSAFTGSVTCYVTGDGGAQAAGSVSSGACTHEGNGFHTYTPAQAETNYDHIGFTFTGSGAIPVTVQVYTTHPQTGDSYALANGASGFAAIKGDTAAILEDTGTTLDGKINTIDGIVDDILVDTGTTLDTLIKDIPTNAELASAFTEIKGATWDSGTDTLEAIRNRGDAAWVTATGFSTLDAAGIRTAIGLASANLDTQLGDLPTNAELAAATIARVTLVDTCTTNTDMRGTDSAALASVCTEARLSELDAGTAGKMANKVGVIQTAATTDIPALIAAAEAKIDTIDGIVDDILEDTGTTLDGIVDAILVDTGTTLDGKIDDLLEALVYKMIITEANGNTEMFNAASASLGSVAAAFTSDGTYTTRKKMVI